MKTLTTPELEQALKALDKAEADYRTAINRAAVARNGLANVQGAGQTKAPPTSRDCQALTLGQQNKKWVRLCWQLRKRIGGTG